MVTLPYSDAARVAKYISRRRPRMMTAFGLLGTFIKHCGLAGTGFHQQLLGNLHVGSTLASETCHESQERWVHGCKRVSRSMCCASITSSKQGVNLATGFLHRSEGSSL